MKKVSDGITLITPYFRRHGIGYLDILVQILEENNGLPERHDLFDQYDLYKNIAKKEQLKNVKKVVYLIPKLNASELDDDLIENGESSQWKEFLSDTKQKLILKSILKTSMVSEDVLKENLKKLEEKIEQLESFPNYKWVKETWEGNLDDLWHIINEFDLNAQLEWYRDRSMIFSSNPGTVQIESLEIDPIHLDDPYQVTRACHHWIDEQNTDSRNFINLWGTRTTFQLAWYYLAWSLPRMKPYAFIECKTVKDNKDRFPRVLVDAINNTLLADLEDTAHDLEAISKEQLDAKKWLEKFKEFGDDFPIMLLGERGTGKSYVIKKVFGEEEVEEVNCAQFQNNPSLAQSELFGHEKGAFSGANNVYKGAFMRAGEKKVLFLDEVHHLDKGTQAMLLKALQTDDNGVFKFRSVGGKEKTSQFQVIVASNIDEKALPKHIIPDLLERINQRILKMKSLTPGIRIIEEFNGVWIRMKFKGLNPSSNPCLDGEGKDAEFVKWLISRERVFPGNYRDLEKIAISCADFLRARKSIELVGQGATLLGYVNVHWEPAKITDSIRIENFLDEKGGISAMEIVRQFKSKLAIAAEAFYGEQKLAAELIGLTPKTLIDWKKSQ